jgi:hypothetical protein
VNFSDKHDNYFSAYKYVVKHDADYVLSDNHPDLTNATAPRTTNAFQKRKGAAKKVRWSMFKLHRQIPKEEQKKMKPFSSCFAKLILQNAEC